MPREAVAAAEFLWAAARAIARRRPVAVAEVEAVVVEPAELRPPERPLLPVRHPPRQVPRGQRLRAAAAEEPDAVTLPFRRLLQRMPVLRLPSTTRQSPS